MRTMKTACERCNLNKECCFYGRPADVEGDRAQNGEWLCADCVEPRMSEMDRAIVQMRRALREE